MSAPTRTYFCGAVLFQELAWVGRATCGGIEKLGRQGWQARCDTMLQLWGLAVLPGPQTVVTLVGQGQARAKEKDWRARSGADFSFCRCQEKS